jgi:ABC-type nitrate/sulfonate/bicarbonate transport system ATPase subunit
LNDVSPVGAAGLLEVRIAHKAFAAASGARLDVLRDVVFTLDPGELGAFVGPSGCGKTTMLKIVAGLDADYRGRVVLPAAAKLGMVFQEPRLLHWRTVEQNVRLVAAAATGDRLAELFHMLGLWEHRTHYPGELSVGLARRVALARALAIEPDLLILDEPFASLDAALARRLRDELATLVDRLNITTILVTHDVEEAIGLADRLFLLSARPAHILAEIPIRTRRADRSANDIASIKNEIAEQLRPHAT